MIIDSIFIILAISMVCNIVIAIAITKRKPIAKKLTEREQEEIRILKPMKEFFEILTFKAQLNGRTIDEILHDAKVPRDRKEYKRAE